MNIFCYQHNIADFRRDTAHLTHEERGVYRDLLDAYYFCAGNLAFDLDKLARIISIHTPSERAALEMVVGSFFTVKHGKLYQGRAESEISKIVAKSKAAKDAVSARELKKHNKEPIGRSSDDHLTKNQEPLIKNNSLNKPPIPPKPAKSKTVEEPITFVEFFAAFPTQRKGSRDKALIAYISALKRGNTEEKINEACRRYAESDEVRRGFAKGCAAWLNDDRFNHLFVEPTRAAANGKSAYFSDVQDAARAASSILEARENLRPEEVD